MDLNIIHKIFPSTTNQSLLKYDLEGIWSISLPLEADLITNIIKKNTINYNKIFDGTGGIGGNVISFSKNFNLVITYEINKDRFKILENNMNMFNINNVQSIHGDCLNNLESHEDVDAYFFDPPWGGPDYKFNTKTTIKLGEYNLVHIVKKIRIFNNSPIFIKLPSNYNLEEFSQFNYNINKIKNYILISIF
jgi:16S rRNA G966 N2-methylase RsmD